MMWPLIRDTVLPRLPPFCMPTAVLRGLFESRLASSIMFQESIPDLLEILGQDPKSDIPLKPRPPFIRASIQPMVFQGIDI